VPDRTYDIAKGWVLRDTPGPLPQQAIEEVTSFSSKHAVEILGRFGYELARQIGGYDILKKRSQPAERGTASCRESHTSHLRTARSWTRHGYRCCYVRGSCTLARAVPAA